MKGHQNLGFDNPQMAHHAKNAEILSDAYYKEQYEQDKDIVYFPVDSGPVYQSQKKVRWINQLKIKVNIEILGHIDYGSSWNILASFSAKICI
jgi:hypothetical protein